MKKIISLILLIMSHNLFSAQLSMGFKSYQITLTGSAQQLSSTLKVRSAVIYCEKANVGDCKIGDATNLALGIGLPVPKDAAIGIDNDSAVSALDLSKSYIKGTAGDLVTIIYLDYI